MTTSPELLSVTPHGDHFSLLEEVLRSTSKNRRGLEPIRLVVPSLHIRDWLQIQIARRLGICMGFDFLMPRDFALEVFGAAGMERAADWTKRRLEWAILEKISAEPGLCPVMQSGASNRDLFSMARAVADRFDQYAHFRPEMLEEWIRKGAFSDKEVEDEKWQRELWLSLYHGMGNNPGLIPSRLGKTGSAEKLHSAFPSITVIGSGSLDPLLVAILVKLAGVGTRVDVHIALPCLGYLGDLRVKALEDAVALSEDGKSEDFPPAEFAANNPLLASMGRHAAGTFVLLGKLDEQYTNWDEPARAAEPKGLLGHLQSAVRMNEDFRKNGVDADTSFSVHQCYGPRRELEVLRDELLRAFQANPDLRPDEVLIAAPSLENYAPLVSSVFQTTENSLPVRLAELPPGESDEVLEGLLAILEITRGRRGRVSEVLDLLPLRAVRAALGLDEDGKTAEFLAEMLRASGLSQGFLESGGASPGGWAFSLNRLAAGAFFGPREPMTNGGNFHLPVADLMGSEFQETSRFLDWLRNLHKTLQLWQLPAPASEWATRLEIAATDLLGADEENLTDAAKCLAFLKGLPCGVPLDAPVVFDWLESEAMEANRRPPLTGAILFGRLRQLHNTPCRILALVGMQDDSFPSRTPSPAWDLLRAKPKIWDRNARVDERQMFLDSLLAPSDQLIITATTRNIRTNKSKPLSTCVEELVSAACTLGAKRGDIVREHPLQPFSALYFTPGSKLERPIGRQICEIAAAANNRSKTALPFQEVHSAAQTPPPAGITTAQLAAFWKNTARGYIKARGIDLPMEEEDDSTLDFPPINLDALQRWKLKDSILGEQLRGFVPEAMLKARLAADRCLPPGFLADAEWLAFQKMQAIANAISGENPMPVTLEVRIAGCRISCPALLANDTVLEANCGKMDKPKHWLPHWLAALMAGASGKKGGVSVFYEGQPFSRTDLPAIEPAVALKTLDLLLAGFLQGQQRPLRFAPQASHALLAGGILNARKSWSSPGWDGSQQPGEGSSPAAMLAWRDSDPFKDEAAETEWRNWAESISRPMDFWKSSKKK